MLKISELQPKHIYKYVFKTPEFGFSIYSDDGRNVDRVFSDDEFMVLDAITRRSCYDSYTYGCHVIGCQREFMGWLDIFGNVTGFKEVIDDNESC